MPLKKEMKKEPSFKFRFLFIMNIFRLYLQNASMKNKESLNLIKTAHRLEAVTTQIKANQNNMAV